LQKKAPNFVNQKNCGDQLGELGDYTLYRKLT